jgi:hypothetical protein
MLFLGFGLNIGVFSAFSTILNSIIVYYFPVSIHDYLLLRPESEYVRNMI